jgi:hypothetical protein
MNAKIIQIAILPESEERWASLLALTADGRIFKKTMPGSDHSDRPWEEVLTKEFDN